MTIKPIGTKILVSPPLRPTMSSEQLIAIPQQFQDDERTRKVLAVGPRVKHVKPGQIVICELHADYVTLEDDTPEGSTKRCIVDESQVILAYGD